MVEIIKPERTTKQGLVLTESIHEEPMNGKVLAIGLEVILDSDHILSPPQFSIPNQKIIRDLEVGDIIIFKARTHHEIRETLGDNQMAFVSFLDVLGLEVKEKK